jgi:hypothetical protein
MAKKPEEEKEPEVLDWVPKPTAPPQRSHIPVPTPDKHGRSKEKD